MIQLKIDTQTKEYSEDVTWQVVAEEYQKEYADEILLVQVNGKLQELQEKTTGRRSSVYHSKAKIREFPLISEVPPF